MKSKTVTIYPDPTGPFVDLAACAAPIAWGGGVTPDRAVVGSHVLIARSIGEQLGIVSISPATSGQVAIDQVGDGQVPPASLFRLVAEDTPFADPIIAGLAERLRGMHPMPDGSLFDGLLTSIIGQSVSVRSAAAAQRKLAAAFHDGREVQGHHFWPLPSADALAAADVSLIRASGVTTRRAEAIRIIASEAVAGNLPTDQEAITDPDEVMAELLALPSVGPWTAASALLWGMGAPDAFPPGDVALLRAARLAYDDAGMTMADLTRMSDAWRPLRGQACRLLWTNLLGVASLAEGVA